MKKLSLTPSACIIASGLFLLTALTPDSCLAQKHIKGIVKKTMEELKPYEYDAYAIKDFAYGPKEKSVVVEFAVFSEEDYKLVFCKTELPQEIQINIYDKNPKSNTKKLIYFDESGKKDHYSCNFRPTVTGSYFIEYKIPAATAPGQKGTMIVLIGVKEKEGELVQQ